MCFYTPCSSLFRLAVRARVTIRVKVKICCGKQQQNVSTTACLMLAMRKPSLPDRGRLRSAAGPPILLCLCASSAQCLHTHLFAVRDGTRRRGPAQGCALCQVWQLHNRVGAEQRLQSVGATHLVGRQGSPACFGRKRLIFHICLYK